MITADQKLLSGALVATAAGAALVLTLLHSEDLAGTPDGWRRVMIPPPADCADCPTNEAAFNGSAVEITHTQNSNTPAMVVYGRQSMESTNRVALACLIDLNTHKVTYRDSTTGTSYFVEAKKWRQP